MLQCYNAWRTAAACSKLNHSPEVQQNSLRCTGRIFDVAGLPAFTSTPMPCVNDTKVSTARLNKCFDNVPSLAKLQLWASLLSLPAVSQGWAISWSGAGGIHLPAGRKAAGRTPGSRHSCSNMCRSAISYLNGWSINGFTLKVQAAPMALSLQHLIVPMCPARRIAQDQGIVLANLQPAVAQVQST